MNNMHILGSRPESPVFKEKRKILEGTLGLFPGIKGSIEEAFLLLLQINSETEKKRDREGHHFNLKDASDEKIKHLKKQLFECFGTETSKEDLFQYLIRMLHVPETD